MSIEKITVRTITDIETIEKTPIQKGIKAFNTYELLKQGAAINPEAPAISFFLTGEDYANSSAE